MKLNNEDQELSAVLDKIDKLNAIGNNETLTTTDIAIINDGAFHIQTNCHTLNYLISDRAAKYQLAKIQLMLSPRLQGDIRKEILGAFQEVFNNIKTEKEALKLIKNCIFRHLDYYCLNLGAVWETILSIAMLSDADGDMLYNSVMQLNSFHYMGTSHYSEEDRESLILDIQTFNEDVKKAEKARKRCQ